MVEGAAVTEFGRALLACHAPLYRYARALCGDPCLAEDLVQETCRRALSARRRPDPATPEQVRPWAFTILRNLWRNELRARRQHPARALGEEIIEEADGPESRLARERLRSEIAAAVDALPEAYREVLLLREVEGFSYAEIGRVVGCPAGTVMSRLARARALLRRKLSACARAAGELGE